MAGIKRDLNDPIVKGATIFDQPAAGSLTFGPSPSLFAGRSGGPPSPTGGSTAVPGKHPLEGQEDTDAGTSDNYLEEFCSTNPSDFDCQGYVFKDGKYIENGVIYNSDGTLVNDTDIFTDTTSNVGTVFSDILTSVFDRYIIKPEVILPTDIVTGGGNNTVTSDSNNTVTGDGNNTVTGGGTDIISVVGPVINDVVDIFTGDDSDPLDLKEEEKEPQPESRQVSKSMFQPFYMDLNYDPYQLTPLSFEQKDYMQELTGIIQRNSRGMLT